MSFSDIGIENEDKIFELVEILDVRGPRYTSYPTAPVWNNDFSEEPFIDGLAKIHQSQKPVALYIHLPYCHKRCLYCGCNSIVSNKLDRIKRYNAALIKDINRISDVVEGEVKHSWLHLGGGTPTHQEPKDLEEVIDTILNMFPGIDDAERSIEVDPRITTEEHIKLLQERGFKRISIGIQDFDENVQKAVKREFSFEDMSNFVDLCRAHGFSSVNIDLIYGLPLQTRDTWITTLKKVHQLEPDRLACFGYAHLPEKIKHQRAINIDELPSPRLRLGMLLDAQRFFVDNGYQSIGIDHFAVRDDKLAIAQNAGSLWRNFMGYTDIHSLNMISFGASAISEFDDMFAQNITNPNEYVNRIENGEPTVVRGYILDEDDRIRKQIINDLMCNLVIKLPENIGKSSEYTQAALKLAIDDIKAYESIGLLKADSKFSFRVTELGKLFLRNIAMHFDRYLPNQQDVKFSRTV
jgi:oxygen-independent coproporphyrinogen III oxidase